MPLPPPIRPTLDLTLANPPERAVADLRAALERAGRHPFSMTGGHVQIHTPREDRRFFTPMLTLEIQPATGGASVHARFSPRPAVWTGFMLGYIALITSASFAAMFALALGMLGGAWAPAGLGAGALGLAAGAVYMASLAGQRLARPQMESLMDLVAGAWGLDPAPSLDRPRAP